MSRNVKDIVNKYVPNMDWLCRIVILLHDSPIRLIDGDEHHNAILDDNRCTYWSPTQQHIKLYLEEVNKLCAQ